MMTEQHKSSESSGTENPCMAFDPDSNHTDKENVFGDKKKLFTIVSFCFANLCRGIFYSLPGVAFPQEMAKIGGKLTYIGGVTTTGVCDLLFGFLNMIPDGQTFFGVCVVVRAVEGLGLAALITASFACIAHTFPDNAQFLIGVLELFTGMGLTLGQPISGFLYQYGGFGAPYWSSGALLLASGIATLFTLPSQKLKIELLGLIGPGTYAVSAPVYGALADKYPQHTRKVLIGGFIVNALGFIFIGPAPILPIPNDMLWLLILSWIVFGLGLGTLSISFQIMSLKARQRGFPESLKTYGLTSGIWNTFYSFGAVSGPITGGYLIDRMGFEWACFVMAGFCTSMCLLLVLHELLERFKLPVFIRSPTQDNATEMTPFASN